MIELRCQVRRDHFTLDVDVELPSPGVTAVFGVSGAGKSTLMAAVAGLLQPQAGRMVFDGLVMFDSTTGEQVPAERRAIGYVFQEGRLFPHLDVRRNLDYGRRRSRERALRIGFDPVVELLGLAGLLDRRIHQLSGGERQRVALGRALLTQPRLLLLDEPLASLDAARKEELLPYLERLRDELGVPILYVTHDFDEVLRIAQHVLVLESGRVGICAPLAQACRSGAVHAITGPGVTGSVLEGTVSGFDETHSLAIVDCGGLPIRVGRLEGGVGTHVRLFIAADDVAIARARPAFISMRNVLEARVERIDIQQGSSVLVELRSGTQRLLSRVTASAVRELELSPGTSCHALFKAVATHGRRYGRSAEQAPVAKPSREK